MSARKMKILWNRVLPYAASFVFLSALWLSDHFFGIWAPIGITVCVACVCVYATI